MLLHGRLRLLSYFGAKWGEQSQTEVAAMRPNALVRILRALCCRPHFHFSTFAKGIGMLSSKLCRSLLWPIAEILTKPAGVKTLPNAS